MKTGRNLIRLSVMFAFLMATLCTAAAGATIYVDVDATGANDGSSWADACNDLQGALAAAGLGDEICVAHGTYKPTTGSDRTATFQLKTGVAIFGGFGGETILSGDIGIAGDNSDNTYHVVTGSGTDATAVLDGFTITAGNANVADGPYSRYIGGGMLNVSGSPTVTNCTFSGNSALSTGGGMYNDHASPTVTQCTFSGNSAGTGGGGMYNVYASPTVTRCTFSGNSAVGGGGLLIWYGDPTVSDCAFSGNTAVNKGGGIQLLGNGPTIVNCTFSGNSGGIVGGGMNLDFSSPTLTNCTFSDNSAKYGGGMYAYGHSDPTIASCTFTGNSAYWGGGMYNSSYSSPMVTNCTFNDNSAAYVGGGTYSQDGSSLMATNCILWGDSAPSGPEIFDDEASLTTVRYSDVQGGWTGVGNIDADPLFADADGRLSPGSPCIDAGDDSAVWVATDLDGNPRIAGLAVDMGAFEAADPAQLVEGLAQQVMDLNLHSGIENSLDAKLAAASRAIDDINENNDGAAINTLQAFINAVEDQRGTKISDADADTLIAAAQQIIALLTAE